MRCPGLVDPPPSDADAAETRPAGAGDAGIQRLCVRTADAGMRKRITWWIDRASRHDPRGRRVQVASEPGIEEEAAVVVGRAPFCSRPVGGRHAEIEHALARRHVGLDGGSLAASGAGTPCRQPSPSRGSSSAAAPSAAGFLLADVVGGSRPRWPRRHDLRLHGGGDRVRPGLCLLRRLERERCDAADLVAAGALLAKDRCYVALKARCRSWRAVTVAARGGDRHERDEQCNRNGCAEEDAACSGHPLHAAGRCASYVPNRSRSSPQISPIVQWARKRFTDRKEQVTGALGDASARRRALAPQPRRRARRARAPSARAVAARLGVDPLELDAPRRPG